MTSAAKIRVAAATALIALGTLHCADELTFSQAFLNAPMGLALAGPTDAPLLFIANQGEDALQVGQVAATLKDFEFVRGDVRYFPIRIPVGKSPSDLAATLNGQYVLALSTADRRVDLVNTDLANLSATMDASGNPVRFEFDVGSHPASMVAAPATRACAAPCLGRFYVTLTGAGQLIELEVNDTPSITAVATYNVGGSPSALATDPNGLVVYVGDATAARVTPVQVEAGAILPAIDVGSAPGPMAMAADSSVLAVGRAASRDLLFIADPAATATVVDANAPFAPKPSCIAACTPPAEPANVCTPVEPFEHAICSLDDQTGLASTAAPEPTSLYLGTVPSRILALVGGPLTARCDDANTSELDTRDFDQSLAVAGVDGLVRFVGLHQVDALELAPQLVSDDLCATPNVKTEVLDADSDAGIADPEFTQILASCPAAPAGRARFACTGDPGVVVLPGQLAPGSGDDVVFRLDWEGIVASADAGRLTEPNTLASNAESLLTADIQVNDTLVLRTLPTGEACPFTALCEMERTVTGVEQNKDSGETKLTLSGDGDSDPSPCYVGGNVRFEVRASNQYLLDGGTASKVRLAPGEVFGPGGVQGTSSGVLFALRAATPEETGASVASCDRYQEIRVGSRFVYRSTISADAVQRFSRNRLIAFRVTDPLDLAVAGLNVEADVSPSPPLGRIPGALLQVGLPGGPQVVFMTYTGTQGLVGFEPFDAQNYDDPSTFEIID